MNNLVIPFRGNMGVQTTPPFLNTYSLSFDGIDDRVQLSSDFVASGEFTISFWMKPTTISGNGSPYVIGRFPLLFNNYIKIDQLGRIYILINQTLVSFFEGVTGGGANNIVLNEWQNIIITRDNSNGLRCYRNGNVFGYNGAPITNSNTLTLNSIGRNYSNTYGFNGALDEIAFWNTDETANISTLSTSPTVDLTDLSPTIWYRNGDNGAWKSPQWLIPNNENKDKVSNYSFEFDGIGDYIELGSISHLQNTTEFSISSWFKTPLTALQGVWTWFDGADGWLELNCSPDGSMVANVTRFSSATFGIAAAGTLTADTWYNATVIFNGSGATNSDRLKLYINGSLITLTYTGTIPTQTGTMLSSGLHIGERFTGVNYFNGNIDEVSIFDSAISIGDVWDGSGEPTDVSAVSGLANYYKMGEEATFSGGVWTVPDSVGSNNGTSNAMTIDDRIGEAPNSTSNALSYNMDLVDRVEDTP